MGRSHSANLAEIMFDFVFFQNMQPHISVLGCLEGVLYRCFLSCCGTVHVMGLPCCRPCWDMVGTGMGSGVRLGLSITTWRDAAEERGHKMGITQGDVLLLPPSNKYGKNASPPTLCPSWSLNLPTEGLTTGSTPSAPY